MKYISIDLETTGLDPENCQILTIGAVIEDTNNIKPMEELPTFHAAILHRRIEGSPFAINMNKGIIESIVHYQTAEDDSEQFDLERLTGMKFMNESDVAEEFYYWLAENDFIELNDPGSGGYVTRRNGKMLPAITNKTRPITISAAGKNFATFDMKFLVRLPRWKQLVRIRQRVLDPSVLFIDWEKDDSLPGLSLCKERAGLDKVVTHDAVDDAKDVIELFRKSYI